MPRASTKSAPKKRATKKNATKKRTTASPSDGTPKTASAKLATYRAKRDFDATPEPSGTKAASSRPRRKAKTPSRSSPAPRTTSHSFVVQKHDASHLHYDFRLEHEGVLLSWSVPKGPSMRPADRRLAVRVEDHPLDYADFEGIIPKGQYGGGTVIVWDRGTWIADGDAAKGLAKGHLAFDLFGEKLRGRFHLVRTEREGEKREHWLLFKAKDAEARARGDVVADRPESVISGRTVAQVAADPIRTWNSTPKKRATKAARSAKKAHADDDVPSLLRRLPLPFELTNLGKILYPESKLTKADLVAYYASVATHALPHLGGRPLMIVRCPSGRAAKSFYQKRANEGVPEVIRRVAPGEGDGESAGDHMVVDDLAGLVALAQLGVLEVHTWCCHADALERPDQLVFDLDPDEGLGWDAVVDAAFLVRERLAALELTSFVKTTGGKGLHVVVPLTRRTGWDDHRAFAKAFADGIVREKPRRYVTNMRLAERKGKLFLDYLRNGRGATAVAPYSTRARPGATVATPVEWDELARGLDPRDFDLRSVLRRLDGHTPDPWRAYATTKQALRVSMLREVGVKDAGARKSA